MMQRMWLEILERFGQEVTLHQKEGIHTLRAMVQPLLDRERDGDVSTPLGLGRQERYRYMGPVQVPLDLDTVVEWNGKDYRVRSAHLVGEGICPHWWGMLYPREEVEP